MDSPGLKYKIASPKANFYFTPQIVRERKKKLSALTSTSKYEQVAYMERNILYKSDNHFNWVSPSRLGNTGDSFYPQESNSPELNFREYVGKKTSAKQKERKSHSQKSKTLNDSEYLPIIKHTAERGPSLLSIIHPHSIKSSIEYQTQGDKIHNYTSFKMSKPKDYLNDKAIARKKLVDEKVRSSMLQNLSVVNKSRISNEKKCHLSIITTSAPKQAYIERVDCSPTTLKEKISKQMKKIDDPFSKIIQVVIEKIKHHPELLKFLTDISEHKLKNMIRMVCTAAVNRTIKYSNEELAKRHKPLFIGQKAFTLFKNLMIETMKYFDMSPDFISNANDNIESYRKIVCCQKPFLMKIGGEEFLNNFSRELMQILTVDPSFSKFFIGVNLQKHAEFLSKFLAFLYSSEGALSSINLGKIHSKLGLTETHLLFFKYNMEKKLRKHKIKEKYIEHFLTVLEPLRNNLLNTIQPWESMTISYGYLGSFCKEFIHKTSQVKAIQTSFKHLSQKKNFEESKKFFEEHQIKLVEYILNKNTAYFKPKAVRFIHKNCQISKEALEATYNILYGMMRKGGLLEHECDNILNEKLLILKNSLLNNPTLLSRMCPHESHNIGKFSEAKESAICETFERKCLHNKVFFQYFLSAGKDASAHCHKMMGLLFHDKSFYSDEDIVQLHTEMNLDHFHLDSFLIEMRMTFADFKIPEHMIEEALSLIESKRRLLIRSVKTNE